MPPSCCVSVLAGLQPGWFSISASLVFQPKVKVAAFPAAACVQRSCVCGCVSAGVCDVGGVYNLSSLLSSKKGDAHLRDSPGWRLV